MESTIIDIQPTSEERAILERAKREGRYLPATAIRAMQIADDPDCNLREFTDLVQQDPILAIEFFRVAPASPVNRSTWSSSPRPGACSLPYRGLKNGSSGRA